MKNIPKVLHSLVVVFLLLSCDSLSIPGADFGLERTFIVQNISGHDVQIIAYYEGEKLDDFSIKNKGKYTRVNIQKPKQYLSNGKNVFSEIEFGSRDSVLIIFDSKKVILYACSDYIKNYVRCSDDVKNIVWMGRKEYKVGKSTANLRTKTSYDKFCYPITKEDYARAVPIEDLKK